MLTECSLTEMQEAFTCKKCAFCCLHGGQVRVTIHELYDIAKFLECDPHDKTRLPFEQDDQNTGMFKLDIYAPCFFLDKATFLCMLQEVKPSFCRDYPFALREDQRCSWLDVLMCPAAREDLNKHFGVK